LAQPRKLSFSSLILSSVLTCSTRPARIQMMRSAGQRRRSRP